MLVMQVGRALHPNHAGIYLGNDWRLDSEPVQALGGDGPFLLRHLYGRLSTRGVFGGPSINARAWSCGTRGCRSERHIQASRRNRLFTRGTGP